MRVPPPGCTTNNKVRPSFVSKLNWTVHCMAIMVGTSRSRNQGQPVCGTAPNMKMQCAVMCGGCAEEDGTRKPVVFVLNVCRKVLRRIEHETNLDGFSWPGCGETNRNPSH